MLSRTSMLLTGASLLALSGAAMAQGSAPVQLGPVNVGDTATKNTLGNDTHLTTSITSSVQDTPQAITVISGETMKAQATTTLGEALRNVPGITIAIGEGGTLAGDQFKLRGFDAKDDIYVDGLRDFGVYTRDSFNYQEIQVLKGPSGLMFGRGTTGGAINSVSKTPTLEDIYSAKLEGGNGDHFRGTADINYQLSDTAAVHIAGMLHDSGVVDRDLVHNHRWGIAPSIALGLGTDTVFTAAYIHQHTNSRQDYGLVVAQPVGSLIAQPISEFGVPRSNFLGFKADQDKNDADIVTVKVNHVVNDWLTISNDARVGVYSRYFRYTATDRCDNTAATNFCSSVLFGYATPTSAAGSANPLGTLAGIGGGGPYQQQSWGAQDILAANAEFHVGGLRNHLIAGFDVSYQNADRTIFAYLLPTTAQYTYQLNGGARSRSNIGRNVFNPDPNVPAGYTVVLPTPANVADTNATATTVLYSTGRATDLAAFITDRLWFTPELSLIGGVRFDNYKASFNSTTVAGTASQLKSPSNLANPRASLVYEPSDTQTYYFSYGKSSVPIGTSVVGSPTPLSSTNSTLDPEISETFELGAKATIWGGLGVTGSIFQVSKSNAVLVDPVSGDISLQSGQKQRVQGFEASLSGEVVEHLNLTAAYTFLDPIVTRDLFCGTIAASGSVAAHTGCAVNPYTTGKQITFVPKNSASVWLDYTARDLVPGLSLGGGMVFQSQLHNAYTTTTTTTGVPAGTPSPMPNGYSRLVVIPETIEFDAVAAYEINKNYRIQFNLNNITDRLNYAQSFGNRGTPAPGRSFLVSLEAKL